MGYAKHIGRVGALAVTLGVGVAIATTPGIAYADPSGSSTTSDSSSTSTSSSTTTGSSTTSTGASGVDGADGEDADSSVSDLNEASGSAGDDTDDDAADEDTADDAEDADDGGEAEEPTSGEDEDTPPSDKDTPPSDEPSVPDDDSVADAITGDSTNQPASSRSASANVSTVPDASEDLELSAARDFTQPDEKQSQTLRLAGPTGTTADEVATAATTFAAVSTPVAPAASEPQPTLVTFVAEVVSNLVTAVMQPLLSWGTGSPIQIPILSAMLSAVRDEMERNRLRTIAPVTSQQTISQLLDPTDQHVLVVGIDGTNLSRVLADPTNENFFELMNTSTNSAPSIVGHTTISNPSWTAILTGAWDNKTGVINNVFTPWTYDKWQTVFTQLETFDPDIETKAIADWDVISATAAAGSVGADEVVHISQIAGDTNWSLTDAAVTAETVETLLGPDEEVPNFMFSYLVQVDEVGHMFGGASEEYKQAIQRTDDNLGAIMDAVAAREAATGEDWTIIVVTDHGHQPQQGFGHGFQSPDETDTFVIVDGPAFGDGFINTDYEIVDVTPTVVSLFGGPQASNLDGVPLMTLGPGVDPGDQADLHAALQAQIAENQPPDPITNLALTTRTIFATIPYLVHELQLPIVGDVLYVATNIPAQIVAFLTGVHGASIFPLLPPPPASTFIPDQETTTVLVIRQDCNGSLAAACMAV